MAGTVVVGTYKQGTAVLFQSATGTHLQNENNDIHLLDSFIMYSLFNDALSGTQDYKASNEMMINE
jgi:hypothetical protein